MLRTKGSSLGDYLATLTTKYSVGPGEILLRWCVDQNIVPKTTGSKDERLCAYLNALNFELGKIAEISQIGQQKHYRTFWTKNFDADNRSCHGHAKRRQGCELYASIIEIRMREAYDLHDSCL
jgi:hypothetical protein